MRPSFERVRSRATAIATLFVTLGALVAAAPARQPERALVFRDVDVFDGTRMLRRTTVLVRDGMIRAVGAGAAIPPSARVVDGTGKTLLPGLFDAHMHLGATYGERFLEDALDFGVTTELEMWGSAASLALRKKMAAGGLADAADFRTAGTGVTVPRGHPTEMDGPPIPTLAPGDDAQAFVDARIAEGADYVKIIYEHAYPTLTMEQLEDVVAAAHRRNALAVVHVTTQSEARDAIAAGADGLAHIFADSPPEPGFAELAAAHHVFVIPTLSVIESAAGGASGSPATGASGSPTSGASGSPATGASGPPATGASESRVTGPTESRGTGGSESQWWRDDRRVAPYLTPSMRGPLERTFPAGFGAKLKLAHAVAAVGALHRAGVPVLAGTDAPAPGLAHGVSLHRELELLVRAGLTPLEALASATSEPARAFGFRDRGRIAEGLRADLLLVNGDPTVDITATRDIVGIWKLGVSHVRHRAADSGGASQAVSQHLRARQRAGSEATRSGRAR